jgi:hypothetical protein
MSEWTSDELTKIGNAEELKIASMRRDGSLRKPVTIWVVRQGDGLYVRSVKGPTGPLVPWHSVTSARPHSSRRRGQGRQLRFHRRNRRGQRPDRRRVPRQVPPLFRKHRQHCADPRSTFIDDPTRAGLDGPCLIASLATLAPRGSRDETRLLRHHSGTKACPLAPPQHGGARSVFSTL